MRAHLHSLSLAASSGSPARASCRATSSNSSSTRWYAQSASSSVIRLIRRFPVVPSRRSAVSAVASVPNGGAAGRVQLEGLTHRAFTFCGPQPVHQPVQRSSSTNPFKEATLQQATLTLLGRIDAPAVVPPSLLKQIRNYRAAVRLCWALRRAKGLKVSDLGRDHGFTRQHVSDYLNDDDLPTRRSLPAEQIHRFEDVCGNTAITQWLAGRHRFTLLEEMQAERALA